MLLGELFDEEEELMVKTKDVRRKIEEVRAQLDRSMDEMTQQ